MENIEIDTSGIYLNDGKYPIYWKQMDTLLKLVWTLHHLSEKKWMTPKIYKELIEHATAKMGIKMYQGQ